MDTITVKDGTRIYYKDRGTGQQPGAIKAQYDCIKAPSETGFYDDLKTVDIPVLVMHGEDDQICPFETTGASSVKLLKHGTLKSYPGLPHGMPTIHAVGRSPP